jgi:hypothetical protein
MIIIYGHSFNNNNFRREKNREYCPIETVFIICLSGYVIIFSKDKRYLALVSIGKIAKNLIH